MEVWSTFILSQRENKNMHINANAMNGRKKKTRTGSRKWFAHHHTRMPTYTHTSSQASSKVPPGGAVVGSVAAAADWVRLKRAVMTELVNSRWKGSISLCAAVCLTCQQGDNFIHITCRQYQRQTNAKQCLPVAGPRTLGSARLSSSPLA